LWNKQDDDAVSIAYGFLALGAIPAMGLQSGSLEQSAVLMVALFVVPPEVAYTSSSKRAVPEPEQSGVRLLV
jgi:hypothetical protein